MPNRKNEKQLFLAGGGGKFDSVKIDERFANALDKKTPLPISQTLYAKNLIVSA